MEMNNTQNSLHFTTVHSSSTYVFKLNYATSFYSYTVV